MPDRDFQRSKLYRWENDVFGNRIDNEALTLDECIALASEMRGKPVTVKDGRGMRRAAAYVARRTPTIALPKWTRNELMVAHEVAHLITYKAGHSGHGGYFVGVYIGLLADYCGESYYKLIESARAAGLRVKEPKANGQAA